MNKNISGSEDALVIVNKNQREARKKKIRSVNQVELMSRSSLQVELGRTVLDT
jgi:hypothetical protein